MSPTQSPPSHATPTTNPTTPVVITSVRYVEDATDAVMTLNTTGSLTSAATITLTATDSNGDKSTSTFSVNTAADTCNSKAFNNNPFMGSTPTNYVTPVNTAVTIQLPSTDLEGAAVTIGGQYVDAISNANATGTISGTSVTITPAAGYTGPIRIALGVRQTNTASTAITPFAYLPSDPNYAAYASLWGHPGIHHRRRRQGRDPDARPPHGLRRVAGR